MDRHRAMPHIGGKKHQQDDGLLKSGQTRQADYSVAIIIRTNTYRAKFFLVNPLILKGVDWVNGYPQNCCEIATIFEYVSADKDLCRY